MRAIIFSGGKPPLEETTKSYIDSDSVIICADSGANHLYNYNIIPNVLLGDFDSINKNILEYFKNSDCKVKSFPSEKDFTDTEAAFSEALKYEPEEIVFLGCTGSRIDHMLANLGLLYRCLKLGITAYIIDDNNSISLYNKSFTACGKFGETFSLQCFGSEVKSLNIINAKYGLENYNLQFGDPRTVSNEFIDKTVNITFKSGIVMFIRAKD